MSFCPLRSIVDDGHMASVCPLWAMIGHNPTIQAFLFRMPMRQPLGAGGSEFLHGLSLIGRNLGGT